MPIKKMNLGSDVTSVKGKKLSVPMYVIQLGDKRYLKEFNRYGMPEAVSSVELACQYGEADKALAENTARRINGELIRLTEVTRAEEIVRAALANKVTKELVQEMVQSFSSGIVFRHPEYDLPGYDTRLRVVASLYSTSPPLFKFSICIHYENDGTSGPKPEPPEDIACTGVNLLPM